MPLNGVEFATKSFQTGKLQQSVGILADERLFVVASYVM